MEYRITNSKESVDGREIFLGEGEDGEKVLLEGLDLVISGKEISLIRDLRKAIQELPAISDVPGTLLMYQGLLKIDGEFYLQIPYGKEIWDNWEKNGEYNISPKGILGAAKIMLKVLSEFKNQENSGFEGFFPKDLLLSGEDEWIMLDPRVRGLLIPYRAEDKLRKHFLPPEVIKGNPWNEKSYIYTIGLTLYYLGAGVFPYPLGQEEKTATAIMKEKPLDPRYHEPEIGGSLAQFILATLEKGPKHRPDLNQAIDCINQLEKSGAFRSTPEEARGLREEAVKKVRSLEKRRNLYWAWQKVKMPMFISAIALVLFFILTRGGYQEVITPDTKPEEVVKYFYQAISKTDSLQLQETLKKGVGKEFDDLVINMNVISKVRLAYEGLDVPAVKIIDLRLSEHPDSTMENPVFIGEYTLKIVEGDHYLVQKRKDLIVMGRIKGEWRIVSVNSQILAEDEEPFNPVSSVVD